MKVLQVIDSFQRGGGAEKFLLDLVVSQRELGADVSVVSLMPVNSKDYIEELEHRGIKHYSINGSKYSIRTLWRLKRLICSGNYDCIHVHLFPANYYVGFVKMLCGNNIKIYFTEHSTSNRRRKYWLFRKIDKFIYSYYNKVFAISNQVSKNLDGIANSEKIVIINNGISISSIENEEDINLHKYLSIPEGHFIIGMVARFSKVKDQGTVIKSIKQCPDVDVVFMGDGETMQSNKDLADSLGVTDRVHFLGNRKDVIALIKGTDAVVLSTQYEGFSISMLESMACGKPFIASAVEGIMDLVEDNALLFPYKDVNRLSEIINRLKNDIRLQITLSEKGRGFAMRYDIKNVGQSYIESY